MIGVRRLAFRAFALPVLALAAGLSCGEPPTDPLSESTRLALVPVFRQGGSAVPALPVDELRVRVTDAGDGAVLAEETVPISPSDVEVEVELRIDATPGAAVVVELALRDGGVDVYTGGPVAVVPSDQPIPVEIDYVGAGACETTVGDVAVGPVGGSPGVVTGTLEIGDCYLESGETFADRWRVPVPRDAGLDFFLALTSEQAPLQLRLETLAGTLVAEGDNGFALSIAAGTYVAVVTSVFPLTEESYELAVSEFDRCDAYTSLLAPGVDATQALTDIDCPLASGRAADLWALNVSEPTPFRIDLMSDAFDARLLLTGPEILDPFLTSALDEDDDGGIGTNALLAGELSPGSYRVWATTFAPGEIGPYRISMKRLAPGAPSLEVRDVVALGVGGPDGVCGVAQGFVFDFGFEDGDGDLVEGGGVTIRLTGIPSGQQEIKRLGWEEFGDLNPYAGYAEILTCETFGSTDTAKLAEFFITDASERSSAIYSTTLTRSSGASRASSRGGEAPPMLRPVSRD